MSTDQESVVVSGIPASIQQKNLSGADAAKLPAGTNRTIWRVFIPLSAVANGVIKDRDIVVDDLGERYRVIANYWNSLGFNLSTERLET